MCYHHIKLAKQLIPVWSSKRELRNEFIESIEIEALLMLAYKQIIESAKIFHNHFEVAIIMIEVSHENGPFTNMSSQKKGIRHQ